MATICLPLFSGRRATCNAAQMLAPLEMPTGMPSSRLTSFENRAGVLFVNADDFVNDLGVEIFGNKARAQALEFVGSACPPQSPLIWRAPPRWRGRMVCVV